MAVAMQVFNKVDKDGDGALSIDELVDSSDISEAQLKRMSKVVDKGGVRGPLCVYSHDISLFQHLFRADTCLARALRVATFPLMSLSS